MMEERYKQAYVEVQRDRWKLQKQNKRYREALEWYSENSPKGNIADEVLEDKNEV